jgi:carboxyl-terminal processing protease
MKKEVPARPAGMFSKGRFAIAFQSTAVQFAVAAGLLLLAAGTSRAVEQRVVSAADPVARLGAAYVRAVKPGESAESYRELFDVVFRRVQRAYAQEVDLPALVAAAMKVIEPVKPYTGDAAALFKSSINASLASLDPHSDYLDAREQRTQRDSISGSFGGLGMEVDMVDGLVRIVAPMEDTPASRAGLKSGDLIVRFDDQQVFGMTLTDAITRMRGKPGTPVKLLIRRPGMAAEFTVDLVRDTIRTQALRTRMEDDVLVLRLSRFNTAVGDDMEKAIIAATATRTPRAVILDMRGNPGGLLNQAVAVADIFLSHGDIVSLRGRTQGNQRTWKANAAEQLAGVPMVVMLDGGSASAAELVAAALQENGRAMVMGQRSYGKGSVQTVISLGADKGALRLTTALYYGPSGRTVQRAGVGPDIELVLASGTPAPRAGRREADRARALPGADEPPPPKASVEQARCPKPQQGSDQALACALAFIKAGGVDMFVANLPVAGGTGQQ